MTAPPAFMSSRWLSLRFAREIAEKQREADEADAIEAEIQRHEQSGQFEISMRPLKREKPADADRGGASRDQPVATAHVQEDVAAIAAHSAGGDDTRKEEKRQDGKLRGGLVRANRPKNR